jgi:hypothetical protein
MKAEKSLVRRRWLSAGAVLTILLLLISSLAVPVYASQEVSSGVKVSKVSDNVYAVVLPGGKMLIETVSKTFTRITFIPQTGNKTVFEIDSAGSEVVMKVNGKEAYRLPKEKIKPVTFTVKPIQTRNLSPQAQVQAFSYAYNYWWDGVYFIKDPYGIDVPYPHPDYYFYGISPRSSWSIRGYKLYHYKFDSSTSNFLAGLPPSVIGGLIGAVIGGLIGGTVGGAIGAIVGALITGIIGAYLTGPLLDEHQCMWWWISNAFIDWLSANAWWLYTIYAVNPALAVSIASSQFLSQGYLRIGPTTFYDAVGAGNP